MAPKTAAHKMRNAEESRRTSDNYAIVLAELSDFAKHSIYHIAKRVGVHESNLRSAICNMTFEEFDVDGERCVIAEDDDGLFFLTPV